MLRSSFQQLRLLNCLPGSTFSKYNFYSTCVWHLVIVLCIPGFCCSVLCTRQILHKCLPWKGSTDRGSSMLYNQQQFNNFWHFLAHKIYLEKNPQLNRWGKLVKFDSCSPCVKVVTQGNKKWWIFAADSLGNINNFLFACLFGFGVCLQPVWDSVFLLCNAMKIQDLRHQLIVSLLVTDTMAKAIKLKSKIKIDQ